MRCSIGGRVTDFEIPPLIMLFYLFREAESGRLNGCSVLAFKLGFRPGDLRGRQRQVGSLAGAAHLLNDNTGVLR